MSTHEAGAVRSYVDYYLTRARTQIQSNFQYRVATYMWLIGMLAEPVVYLVVWTTITEERGTPVGGYTAGPFAAVLWLAFDPEFDTHVVEIAVFCVAIWGAYLIRTMFLTALGMVTFWTTRVSALFELFIGLELLLSGRLVPLPIMPDWAEDIADVLPFKWSFFFPIDVLVGDMTNRELLEGLGMQLFWIVVLTALFLVVWRFAIRRYS